MSDVAFIDDLLSLASQAAIAHGERRRILLAELRIRLDNADGIDPHELEALRLEIGRLASEAA